jgi:hypothetical protein
MWEPWCLSTLWALTAFYRDSFIYTFKHLFPKINRTMNIKLSILYYYFSPVDFQLSQMFYVASSHNVGSIPSVPLWQQLQQLLFTVYHKFLEGGMHSIVDIVPQGNACCSLISWPKGAGNGLCWTNPWTGKGYMLSISSDILLFTLALMWNMTSWWSDFWSAV